MPQPEQSQRTEGAPEVEDGYTQETQQQQH